MKSVFKTLTFIPFIALLFCFNSCQEEAVEVLQEDPDSLLEANSTIANLMFRTSLLDGSYDNILDNASSIAVNLPVTVFANGLEIIVDSEEEFEVVESIFDEFDDDNDNLEFLFPITIRNINHQEITINNVNELEVLVEDGNGENQPDEDIECVDFAYPLVYSVFDTGSNTPTTVTVYNDEDMHAFLQEIDADDVISLNFPIQLIYTDGTDVTVNSMSELEEVLAGAVNFCDEDDDNDYSDDDFDLEELNELLTTCPWEVKRVVRNNNDETPEYLEFLMLFNENGTVKVRKNNGSIIQGTWETTFLRSSGVVLNLNLDNLPDFTLEWQVAELGNERIKLYTPNGNKIILKKNCDAIVDHTIDDVYEILQECLWRIQRLHVNGNSEGQNFIATPLEFLDNNMVKMRVEGSNIEGNYDIYVNSENRKILQIFIEDDPHLRLLWEISIIENNKLTLINEQNEMLLFQYCPGEDEHLNIVNEIITSGGYWKIAYLEVDSEDFTSDYEHFKYKFYDSGKVRANPTGASNIYGSWLSYRYNDAPIVGLNFGEDNEMSVVNGRWEITETEEERFELIDFSADGNIERKVVFEKR
ncbi:hypothetical protein [Urechidicola sp. KH5]